jgi:hypothetical protein
MLVPPLLYAPLYQVQVGTALGVAVPPNNQWQALRAPPKLLVLSLSQLVTATGVAVH